MLLSKLLEIDTNILRWPSFKLVQSNQMDQSLFIHKDRDTFVTSLIYVDDVIIAERILKRFKRQRTTLMQNLALRTLEY